MCARSGLGDDAESCCPTAIAASLTAQPGPSRNTMMMRHNRLRIPAWAVPS